MTRNPFNDTKLEYEIDPILWFSQRSRRIAERGKSTFVSGTRGSGKTSILRSLSTRYISEIASLNEQFLGRRLDWFGVYIRLQDAFADVLSSRPDKKLDVGGTSHNEMHFAVFAQYVELLMLSAMCSDLISLRNSRFLKFSAGSEYDAIRQLVSDSPVIENYAGKHIETLAELLRICRQTLDMLFSSAIGAENRLPRQAFVVSPPGEIISSAARSILPIIRGDRFRQGRKLQLKLMIDDCEVLPLRHQTYLNTLIRNTTAPNSWVIAYVGNLYDSRRTIRENQMLSDADREIEFLDEIKEAEFKQLCNRVASIRLYRAISPEARVRAGIKTPNDCFNLQARLGRFSLNSLIERSFQKSVSDTTQQWTQKALQWRELFDRNRLESSVSDDLEIRDNALPYTIALAAERLGITIADAERDLQTDRSRRALERRLARKQRAAFLILGRETGIRMLHAGERIVTALSDSCIRDFLDIMREIYDREVKEHSERSLIQFVRSSTAIAPETQSAAIYAAADAKVRGVMTIADPYGVGVTRLIDALGHLTAELQTSGVEAVRNPEVGLFRLQWPRTRDLLKVLGHDPRELNELFRKSELDGFIREVDERDRVISRPDPRLSDYRLFRLHRRFAPAFGFSFRGPYSVLPLPESAFVEVLIADAQFTISDWVKRAFNRNDAALSSANQLNLPELDGPGYE